MKKYLHTLYHSLAVGIIAGGVAVVCELLSIRAWVVFFAWANYFLHGSSFKKSLKMMLALVVGVTLAFLASILIPYWSTDLEGFQKTLISGLVIFFVATILVYLECIEGWEEMIPATFLGTVLFFASGVQIKEVLHDLFLPLFFGVVAGLFTILARKRIDVWLNKRKPPGKTS